MAVDSEMVKRKLNDLRVVDLRAELDNRGIDKSGVKAVLIERLHQALMKEGHNPDDYLFEVVETPVKKNTKRTNKKLTRDDESETHSNVDEAPIDLCEEEGKFDSDDEVIDEKFFQVLETTDMTEDPMGFAIEEDEGKFLLDEEEVGTGAKDDEKAHEENDQAKNGDETDDRDQKSPVEKKVNGITAEGDNSTEFDSSAIKSEDDTALIVTLDESQNFLDSELASPTPQEEGSTTVMKDEEGDDEASLKTSAAVASEGKDANSSDSKSSLSTQSSKVEDGSSKSKTASVFTTTGKESTDSDDKQEDAVSSPSANKSKSTVGSVSTTPPKDTKVQDRAKQVRPVGSGKNLWVTGLSSNTRATDLKALFSKHGKVVGAKIVSNARSSGSRCYGFVTMATIEDAGKCIQHLHRTELHGRLISVEKAKAEPVSSNRKVAGKPVSPVKKTPEKKDGVFSETKEEVPAEKQMDDVAEVKEKETDKTVVSEKKEKEKAEESSEGKAGSKEGSKDRDAERRKRVNRSESHKSSKERSVIRGGGFSRPFVQRDRRPFRRPILHRPFGLRPRNPLTFRRITDERMRQRSRDYERKNREEERRRHQDMVRQREIERKQREESVRLERERERLRIEREKLERERAEVLRLEREKQRMERERIEREREELRKNRERLSGNRFEDQRRPIKRTFEPHPVEHIEERKRPNIAGPRFVPTAAFHNDRRTDTFERKADHFNDNIRRDINRRDPPVHDHDDRRPVRTERFDRGPPSRDTDLRGHGRDDRGTSYRDGEGSNVHRPGPKDDWKQPPDRRSGVNSNSDGYAGSGGRQGESRYVDRSGDSWQGHGGSQSDHREGKSYSGSGGMGTGPRDQWGGDGRKMDSGHTQSWSRSDNVPGSRWGGMSARGGQTSMGIGQSMVGQNSMYGGPPSTVGQSNTMGMGSSTSSSFNSDRFDSYKGPNSMRRY